MRMHQVHSMHDGAVEAAGHRAHMQAQGTYAATGRACSPCSHPYPTPSRANVGRVALPGCHRCRLLDLASFQHIRVKNAGIAHCSGWVGGQALRCRCGWCIIAGTSSKGSAA